jgi:hypothetical protein
MSREERPLELDKVGPSAGSQAPLVSLEERIQLFKDSRNGKTQDSQSTKGSDSNLFLCLADPIERAGDAAGGKPAWHKITSEIEAGSGKSVKIEFAANGGQAMKHEVSLADIGNKKGYIETNGTNIRFQQTDGWPYDSTYNLGWIEDKKAPTRLKFSWK